MEDMQFSVIMSVYQGDNAIFFKRALSSIVEDQIRKPDEIVLVVDGPVSKEIDIVISEYEDKYDNFKVIRLNYNVGLGNSLKIAIENASYELIARMDSDDISLPTRFKEQLDYFKKNSEIDIIGGDIAEFIDSETNIVAYRRVPKNDKEIKEYLKKRCPFNHMTVMYKKNSVQKVGGYIDLFWNEDYYLWIRMAEYGMIMKNTGTIMVNVRTGKDMYRRRGGKKYFKSEKFLQKYMLDRNIINRTIYVENILKRWIVQRILPNFIRGWVFRIFARKYK